MSSHRQPPPPPPPPPAGVFSQFQVRTSGGTLTTQPTTYKLSWNWTGSSNVDWYIYWQRTLDKASFGEVATGAVVQNGSSYTWIDNDPAHAIVYTTDGGVNVSTINYYTVVGLDHVTKKVVASSAKTFAPQIYLLIGAQHEAEWSFALGGVQVHSFPFVVTYPDDPTGATWQANFKSERLANAVGPIVLAGISLGGGAAAAISHDSSLFTAARPISVLALFDPVAPGEQADTDRGVFWSGPQGADPGVKKSWYVLPPVSIVKNAYCWSQPFEQELTYGRGTGTGFIATDATGSQSTNSANIGTYHASQAFISQLPSVLQVFKGMIDGLANQWIVS